MGDQQIIQLFFQRCEEAITQTQKKYGALCRSVAQRLLTDPRDTEECVSDTYLRVWNAIPPERPRSLRAYLARITRNLALDRYNYCWTSICPGRNAPARLLCARSTI